MSSRRKTYKLIVHVVYHRYALVEHITVLITRDSPLWDMLAHKCLNMGDKSIVQVHWVGQQVLWITGIMIVLEQ
ncbi:hypothetical protein D3C80_1753000 [compost metagenome]